MLNVSIETTNTNLGQKPMIYPTCGEHTNHYTNDVVWRPFKHDPFQNFWVKMRDHMPKVHKEFIETIAEKSNIRNYGK
jgi:hypothetical protein